MPSGGLDLAAIKNVKLRPSSGGPGSAAGTPRPAEGSESAPSGRADLTELEGKISKFLVRAEGGSSAAVPAPPVGRQRSKKEEATSELAAMLAARRAKNGERA